MQTTTGDLILAIHDASMHLSPAEFQIWALGEIRRHVDFDFAIWGGGNGQSRRLHTATVLDQVDTFFDTWESVKHEDQYADLVIGNTGKTWSIEQLPGFRHSRAYNEHWRCYGARQMVSTMEVDPHTGLHIFVTLARDSQTSVFKDRDTSLKNVITQHLFLASRHNDMHYLHASQTSAAFIDRQGLVHASMQDLRALFANEWNAQAGSRLPEAVTLALWHTGCYRGRNLSLHANPVGKRLLVRAVMTPRATLSPREHEIASLYSQGNSYKVVAQILGVSPTTVRTHLARVYQKLGISDKGALANWLVDN